MEGLGRDYEVGVSVVYMGDGGMISVREEGNMGGMSVPVGVVVRVMACVWGVVGGVRVRCGVCVVCVVVVGVVWCVWCGVWCG